MMKHPAYDIRPAHEIESAAPIWGELGRGDKYQGKAIRWSDHGDHYELVFTDDFVTPSSGRSGGMGEIPTFGSALLTDIIIDMKNADKSKEVHVFIGSLADRLPH